MNETLQKALSDLINTSLKGLDTAKGFLTEQIPDVIKQLLLWHGVYNFVFFVVGMLGILTCVLSAYYTKKYMTKQKSENTRWFYSDEADFLTLKTIPVGIGGIVFVIGLIVAAKNINLVWLQIWLAPKVWLIEYAAELVK